MLKTIEDISATKKRLTIEIPAETIEKEIRDSLEKLRRTTTLPGFRPGKAPLDLIEKRFGKNVEADVLDRVIPEGYLSALKEADISPVANPVVEEKIDFKRRQPLSLSLTVEIMPEIDLRYEGIKVKDIPVSVGDSDIEDVLKRQQEEKATYKPSEGPIEMNDLIVIDYSAEGADEKDKIFKVGSSIFPEDFSKSLIGKNKGEKLSVEATFPEDHPNAKLAGKRPTMEVVIKDVKKVDLPAIDDELAKDFGYENLEEMKKHIGEGILKAKKNEVAKIQKGEIIGKLIESHEFDVPESLVEQEAAALASASAARKRREAGSDEQDMEALKEETKPNAVRNVKASLLIDAIGKKQGVSVTDDEVKNAIVSLAMRLSVSPENIMKFYMAKDGSLDGLKNSLFEEKVLDLILSKAEAEKGE